jgi:hypothetical protein
MPYSMRNFEKVDISTNKGLRILIEKILQQKVPKKCRISFERPLTRVFSSSFHFTKFFSGFSCCCCYNNGNSISGSGRFRRKFERFRFGASDERIVDGPRFTIRFKRIRTLRIASSSHQADSLLFTAKLESSS